MVLLFFFLVECNGQVVCFNKIAPVAILFATTGVKIVGLYFFPGRADLLGDSGDIGRSNDHFFFANMLMQIITNRN